MKIHKYKKSISNWIFELEGKRYTKDSFLKLEKVKQLEILKHRLFFVKRILNILYKSELLLVDTIDIAIKGGSDIVKTDNFNPDFIIDNLLSKKIGRYNFDDCCFTGLTNIKCNLKNLKERNIIALDYSLYLNEFTILIYSDLWIPISINEEQDLQIDVCLENAPRLENSLKAIKELTTYANISSDEGCDYSDNTISQRGFRMYSTDYIEDFDIPKEKIELVKKYIWEYRNQ